MVQTEIHSRFLFLLLTLAVYILLFPSLTYAQLTWSPPALLNDYGTTDTLPDTDPDITTDNKGNWVAVWQAAENLGGVAGTDWDIFVSRSTDNGATWTAAALLDPNGTTDTGGDFRPDIETDGAGNWVTVWTSDETLGGVLGTDWDLFVSRSTDNGATWTASAVLNSNAATDTSFDITLSMETDGAGNWLAVWGSSDDLGGTVGTDTDIFVSRSTDAGATWTAVALFNTNGTTDTGNDFVPILEPDGAGNWVAVWQSRENLGGTAGTDTDLFVSRSTDNGATWTAPTLLNSNGTTDTESELLSDIATDGTGNWVVVWHSSEDLGGTAGTDMDIFVSTSTDNGATWTAPALLNTNGTTDTGLDSAVSMDADSLGNWVAVWVSGDNPDDPGGTDDDILVARAPFAAPGLPASGGWMLGVLALTLLVIGRKLLRRATSY